MHELIGDITLCILFAWALGLLAHFFRQPLILAYLIAGFFNGPFGTGWVKSQESISIISELGLIFMLFMIGLEIDLKKIVRAGRVILFAAGGQLVGGCVLGILFFMGIGLSMGGGGFDALYLCIACGLSSTVIIVKVLYEKRERRPMTGSAKSGTVASERGFSRIALRSIRATTGCFPAPVSRARWYSRRARRGSQRRYRWSRKRRACSLRLL